MGEAFPRAFITRNREMKGVKYFGPYTQSWAVRETLDTLLKVYPVRSCSKGVFNRAQSSGRACLLGDIGKCAAPCVGRVDSTAHKKIAADFVDFMGGGDTKHVEVLRKRMYEASDNQQYELAASMRDDVDALERVLEKSTVVFSDQTDADLFGIADDELAAAVSQFIVRGGRIRGVRGWVVDKATDAQLQVNSYRADNGNAVLAPLTMPYGVTVREASVTIGLKHKFSDKWVGNAKVGYFDSKKDTTGGNTNFKGPLAYISFEHAL
jgi:excinuclease ABC subunit C